MDYQDIFEKANSLIDHHAKSGKIANYIPELALVDPDKFGVHLVDVKMDSFGFGDYNEKFSIQSIAKVISLVMAYRIKDGELWERVGVEPSGTPFNSLIQLEYDKGIPRNPFINAGAIVICDILLSNLKKPKKELLKFVRQISGNSNLEFSNHIAQSEKTTGYRNAALINLMKDFGNIHNNIDDVMDFYFNLCSIEMTCEDLSKTLLFLANDGFCPISNVRILSQSRNKRINAIMQLCGLYDEAGEFSFKVGLPGKSGVGGGIIAIHPLHYSIAVWSPRLNIKGNSQLGMEFLEHFTSESKLSIF